MEERIEKERIENERIENEPVEHVHVYTTSAGTIHSGCYVETVYSCRFEGCDYWISIPEQTPTLCKTFTTTGSEHIIYITCTVCKKTTQDRF